MKTKMTTPKGAARERVTNARNLSKAESEVALWVERNFDNLPFETAADLASGAGVSEMTVGRFVRRLGYANFKAFKAAVQLVEKRCLADSPLTKQEQTVVWDRGKDSFDQLLAAEKQSRSNYRRSG